MAPVTDEPRAPIFRFLFAAKPPTPGAPQIRWMRIPARGPWRLALLIIATVAMASLTGSALLALAGIRTVAGLAIAAAVIVVSLPLFTLLARGWIQGTYVNDAGVRIVRMWSTRVVPWAVIEEVRISGRRWRRIDLLAEGMLIPTTIGNTTLDSACRRHTWDSSLDRMHIWHRESGPTPTN